MASSSPAVCHYMFVCCYCRNYCYSSYVRNVNVHREQLKSWLPKKDTSFRYCQVLFRINYMCQAAWQNLAAQKNTVDFVVGDWIWWNNLFSLSVTSGFLPILLTALSAVQLPREMQTIDVLDQWNVCKSCQGLILCGWRLSSRNWNPISSPWMKQLTWLRIVHSGHWCLHLALCTPSGACHKWLSYESVCLHAVDCGW